MNKVRIIPLGGLGEIGMNMTVFETENDMIAIDCGVSFPDDTMLGVDLVAPDITYIKENIDKFRGLFITHAHEDHIGAIPYFLQKVKCPIYATRFTLGVIKQKIYEKGINVKPHTRITEPGKTVKVGDFKIEFINVNHSIPGSVAMAIKTPAGTIIHTGDFKIDLTPTYGEPFHLHKFAQYGQEGVKLLLCESTNAEKPGTTVSESSVAVSIEQIFDKYTDKRIMMATFSSNVYRLQSAVNAAIKHNRKIVLAGKSMLSISDVAIEQGILKIPDENLIDIEDMDKYNNNEICLITTGSQGEPMSVLYRMAFSQYRNVSLDENDIVILSSHTIPGNEKLVNAILNKLAEKNVTIVDDYNTKNIHASGHACQEELKTLQMLVKPEYFMPIHGEYKHMCANKNLAMLLGIPEEKIIIGKIGNVIEINDDKVIKTDEIVQSGKILIDGTGIGDVGPVVLRERLILSQNGIVFIMLVTSRDHTYLIAEPEVITKGFVYVREADEIIEKIKEIAVQEFNRCIDDDDEMSITKIQENIKDKIYRYTKNVFERCPMVIPVIKDV